jgi:hypothetical protein
MEQQEIPKEGAAVMPVGEPRQRRRVCNLTPERDQNRKERTPTYRGSKRKSAAACRKVSHHKKVAWPEGKLVRRIGNEENCGPRKEFSPSGIRMTHSAKVTLWNEHGLQRQRQSTYRRVTA